MAILLCIVVLIIGGVALIFWLKNKQNAEVVQEIEKDDKTYTLEKMRDYVKKRLDEITKINLYDIGLSEEELKRRKNKKYALKKALKGCTYGDVNDKRYVKELIFDLACSDIYAQAVYEKYGYVMKNELQQNICLLYTSDAADE